MKRRQFIRAAGASLLLTTAVPGVAPAASSPRRNFAFFDKRFQRAGRVADSWRDVKRLIEVDGDITQLWRDELERLTRSHALYLRGVTTESFLFCLRILASEHAKLDAQVSRLDGNLLLWTMYTTPKA